MTFLMIKNLFLSFLLPLTISCLIKILRIHVFYAQIGTNTRKAYGLDGVPHIVTKICVSVFAHCLVKLFQFYLSTSLSPSCWQFAYIQPIPKQGDRSSTSKYIPIALISRLFECFESFLNRKTFNYLICAIFYLIATI